MDREHVIRRDPAWTSLKLMSAAMTQPLCTRDFLAHKWPPHVCFCEPMARPGLPTGRMGYNVSCFHPTLVTSYASVAKSFQKRNTIQGMDLGVKARKALPECPANECLSKLHFEHVNYGK